MLNNLQVAITTLSARACQEWGVQGLAQEAQALYEEARVCIAHGCTGAASTTSDVYSKRASRYPGTALESIQMQC